MNMDEFIDFQDEMLRKQADRNAQHEPLIKCRFELKAGPPCIVQQSMQNCLDCAAEHAESKKKEKETR